MKDTDYTQQYQSYLNKKKKEPKKQSAIDQEILNQASQLEEQTYQSAKAARQKLEQSHSKQKETTTELKAQGEKLKNIKEDAKSINVNVKEGHQLSHEIKEAGKIFKIPFLGGIKKMFRRTKPVKETKKDFKEKESSEEEEVMTEKGDKTDDELRRILANLKSMRKEASGQELETKKQKADIEDIARYNKNSEFYMDKTNEELRKL